MLHLNSACILLLFFYFGACNNNLSKEEKINSPDKNPIFNSLVEIKTYQDSLGWAYDIYIDKRMYIHQPHIPAVAGNHSFTTEENAQKTATFVADKIRHNIMPPSVTERELDSLGVLK